jgi:hypothetical protein
LRKKTASPMAFELSEDSEQTLKAALEKFKETHRDLFNN